MFHGSMVAIVTPMHNKKIDFNALAQLIEFHIAANTSAIVVAGTTGESATLTETEKANLIRFVVEQVKERIPVIAGTAHQSTEATITLTKAAMNAGADAALIMTPAYIKPTPAGLVQHYEAIAKAVSMPIIVYNVPSRTACDLKPETLAALRNCPNIIGIKDASGDLARVKAIRDLCHDAIDIYSGEDNLTKEVILAGGKGVISVTANVAPKAMSEMCEAALKGNVAEAARIDTLLAPLHKALFIESNPIPVKWALHEMGMIDNELRLPLTPLSIQHHALVREAMYLAGISVQKTQQPTGT